MRFHIVVAALTFLFLACDGSLKGPSGFGTIINHVFSCDCFINQNDLNPLEKLFKPVRPINVKKDPASAPFQKNPKLVVIHAPQNKNPFNNNHRVEDGIPTTTKSNSWDPLQSLENVFNFLHESQQKLNSWIQSDQKREDPTKYPYEDFPKSESNLFSLERGSITRNIVRLGRFLQLFDKFDCRCAGNVSSILNAEKFVRFTIAHV